MTESNKNDKNGSSLLKGFISRQKEDLKQDIVFDWPERYNIYLISILTFFVLLVLFTPEILLKGYDWKLGEMTKQDIYAPFSFSVENKQETERLRKIAEQSAPMVYKWDTQADDKILVQTLGVLSTAKALSLRTQISRAEKVNLIQEKIGFPISVTAAESLLRYANYRQLRETLEDILVAMDSTPILNDDAIDMVRQSDNLVVFKEGESQLISYDQISSQYGSIESLSQFNGDMRKLIAKKLYHPEDAAVRQLVSDLCSQLIQSNLAYDSGRSDEERIRYRKQVRAVLYSIKKGDIVIPAGKPIGHYEKNVLDELSNNRWKYGFSILAGRMMLLVLFGYLSFLFFKRYYPRFIHEINSVATVCLLIVITVGISRTILWMGGAPYWIPIASFAMLAGILFEIRFALLMTVELSVFLGVMQGLDIKHVFLFLISGTIASFSVAHIRKRTDLVKAGLLVSMVNVIGIIAIFFFDHPLYSTFAGKWSSLATDLLPGVGNGMLSYGITLALLPLFEWLFNLTTDVKLLEFTDPRAPALAKLEEEAPGTYQHSLTVGQLGEVAALAIGANALLCRIGGYYQDIGKILKPEYFVENHRTEEDRKIHDKLTINMSCLIIKNHVKYGIELAKEYKLPPPVIDIIAEHHGTSLMNYFYKKAIEINKEEGGDDEVDDQDFRYPGPKPQSTEAAIVMLADSVEAAVTSLRSPTPGSIQAMVHKVINEKFTDDQLNECEITMRDLELIKEALTRTLLSKYHRRISYPSNSNGTKK